MKKEGTSTIVEALDRSGNVIKIKNLKPEDKGKRGYYCRSCGLEMQANIGQDIIARYFSHDPKDGALKGKCTYMDETFRHKTAKEILQGQKFIKVPTLYKYPPIGIEGIPNKLADSKTIVANSVRNELVFFEDDDGNIQHTASESWRESEGRNLLIRPDVTFFDHSGKPILLIELVATHKLKEDKKEKIRAIGIDCIQIKIPVESEENIAESLRQTQNTKWIYNGTEAQTEYVFIPRPNDGGVYEIDEQQREFLRELIICRKARIRNLIRGFKKCILSESYRSTEEGIRSEISRVEGNTDRERERAGEIQNRIREQFEKQNSDENQRIGLEISRIDEETKRERSRSTEIQNRIREEVEREQFPELGGVRARRAKLADEKGEVERRYSDEKEKLERDEREYRPDCTEEIVRLREELEELQRRHPELDTARRRIREEKDGVGQKLGASELAIKSIRKQEADLPESAERDKTQESERFTKEAERIESEFGERMQAIRIALEAGDLKGISESTQGLKELFGVRRILNDYISERWYFVRLTKARKCYDGKSWKNWPFQKP